HPDARRSGVGVHDTDDLLARELRVEPAAARGIPEHRSFAWKRASQLNRLNRLFEADNLPAGDLPALLTKIYDGGLTIPDGTVYANFVSSIDGIVALEGGTAPSGGVISGRNEA